MTRMFRTVKLVMFASVLAGCATKNDIRRLETRMARLDERVAAHDRSTAGSAALQTVVDSLAVRITGKLDSLGASVHSRLDRQAHAHADAHENAARLLECIQPVLAAVGYMAERNRREWNALAEALADRRRPVRPTWDTATRFEDTLGVCDPLRSPQVSLGAARSGPRAGS